jgi:Flp pilus assembly protein CpaB
MLGTRSGTLALAAVAAVAAALVLLVFLSHYKDSVRGGAAPSTALVAGSLIPKGTAGDAVIGQHLSKTATVTADQLTDGALANTESIAGKVAVRDIYPGQQITAADFAGSADPVRGKLTGDQRALAVPVDGAHGLLGQVRTGDRVDVFAGFNMTNTKSGTSGPVLRTIVQDVLVLDVPASTGGGALGGGSRDSAITIRVTDRQAAAIAFAADNGKVWFALRPPAGATEQSPTTMNLGALLAGSAPIDAGGGK